MLGVAEKVIGKMNHPLPKHFSDTISSVTGDFTEILRAYGVWIQFDAEARIPVLARVGETEGSIDPMLEDGGDCSENYFRGRRRW
jgi:hypothetical protein